MLDSATLSLYIIIDIMMPIGAVDDQAQSCRRSDVDRSGPADLPGQQSGSGLGRPAVGALWADQCPLAGARRHRRGRKAPAGRLDRPRSRGQSSEHSTHRQRSGQGRIGRVPTQPPSQARATGPADRCRPAGFCLGDGGLSPGRRQAGGRSHPRRSEDRLPGDERATPPVRRRNRRAGMDGVCTEYARPAHGRRSR